MKSESVHSSRAASWSGDFWGGLVAMLVALPSSIAFGVLVYTAIGPEYASDGAMAGMVGAAAIGLVAPLVGRTGGLVSAPCAPAAAVLTALAASLLAGAGAGIQPDRIPGLLALTALFSAVLQVLYGMIGGGRLIKFVPYPVVSGYLSGVGVLIALGQIPKLLGLPPGTELLHGLAAPALWKWQGLVVGLATMVVMAAAPRVTKRVPAAVLGLLGGLAAYLVLGVYDRSLMSLEANALVIGPIEAKGTYLGALSGRVASLLAIDLADLKLVCIPALTLSLLLSIDTLKTCVVLDALTRSRHNANRELRGQGIGNLAAFLAGGMPGAGTMGPTLVNVTSGGRTFRSGLLEGAFVVLALLLLGRLVAWLPIGALAGILLVIAWRMFDRSMFRLLRYRAARLDFAVILAVILVAVTVDLIAASGVGICLAILLFIRDQVRGSVIRRKLYLNEISSKTRRLAAEREILERDGRRGVFCELQGNLFFGTTDQLYSQLEPDLKGKRFILLDMRRVQSLDYTAAHLFEQLQAQLEDHGGCLLFSGMPSTVLGQRDFENYLAHLGLVGGSGSIKVCDTLDGALEWIEERILEDAGLTMQGELPLLELEEIELFRGFSEEALACLSNGLKALSVPQGEKVFSKGSDGGEIFFIRRGSVRILLPLEGGKRHHLATFGRGDFFGELSFLDYGKRSADAEAKVSTDLYVLSRTLFDEHFQDLDVVGAKFFARLALAIGNRLRLADVEMSSLQER